MSNHETSEAALADAADMLKSTLGPLDDLPPELRNTVANVYYRFFVFNEHVDAGGKTRYLEPFLPSSSTLAEAFQYEAAFQADSLAAYQVIADMVVTLREAKREAPAMFDFLVTHLLDDLKYRIPNAENKPAFWRAIERMFRTPREISGLYDEMKRRALL